MRCDTQQMIDGEPGPRCSFETHTGPHSFDAKGLADARALWAVRVLDAYADAYSIPSLGEHRNPPAPVAQGYAPACYFSIRPKGKALIAPTRDAARLAAALAVYPELPADVRAELGECP